MTDIWLWSDLHFNHGNIEKHCTETRPGLGVDHMNHWLINLWNACVGKRDDAYVLGDFAYKSKDGWDLLDIFKQMNGNKFLVRGNHDWQNPTVFNLPWCGQWDLRTVKQDGMSAVCCHYPLETWDKAPKGRLMLYGHSHGGLQRTIPHRFDVGVDACGRYGPVTLADYWQRAQEQEAWSPVDHHS